MISRVILAVLLCGITAGFVFGVMQQVRLTPIIEQAETYESGHDHAAAAPAVAPEAEAGHSHDHAAASTGHVHDESAWAPADGVERTLFTYAASMITGAGFAALLTGVAFVFGANITRANGWVWGLCGFLAVSLAPAAGLAPELPGMPAADVTSRQLWWVATIIATGAGLWLLAFRRESWAIPLALLLVALPHVIGAPQPADHTSTVPATLASHFASLSLAANAVMWLVIGTLLGRFLPDTNADATS